MSYLARAKNLVYIYIYKLTIHFAIFINKKNSGSIIEPSTKKPTRVNSNLIGCPIHMALCHICSLTKQQTGNIHVCKNAINNSKKCRYLRGPIHFEIFTFSFFGTTVTKIFLHISYDSTDTESTSLGDYQFLVYTMIETVKNAYKNVCVCVCVCVHVCLFSICSHNPAKMAHDSKLLIEQCA